MEPLDLIRDLAIYLAVLGPSVILHEIAHGWVALMFGDRTAKEAGRLSLNPVRHVDPFGTIILPGVLAATGAPVFGWAKPVPVTPRNLRKPRSQSLWVSLAGPATNLVLLGVATLAIYAIFREDGAFNLTALEFALRFGFVNLFLMVFNLLPIPPLDGSALIERVLPASALPRWFKFQQYSMGFFVLLMFFGARYLSYVFDPVVRLWGEVLPPLVQAALNL